MHSDSGLVGLNVLLFYGQVMDRVAQVQRRSDWVEIEVGKDAVNLDDLISPDQRLHVALALQ